MADELKRNARPGQATPLLSLDAWAVILALALALAIWIGWIKQVAWWIAPPRA
jgi:hypothetical protein